MHSEHALNGLPLSLDWIKKIENNKARIGDSSTILDKGNETPLKSIDNH